MDAAGRAHFEQMLQGDIYTGVQTMNKTPFDKGVAAGELRLAVRAMEKKFGPLPAEARDRLSLLSFDELCELTLNIGTATSLAELGLTGGTVASA